MVMERASGSTAGRLIGGTRAKRGARIAAALLLAGLAFAPSMVSTPAQAARPRPLLRWWLATHKHMHTAGVAATPGVVWTWGRNYYGQLGLGNGNVTDVYSPTVASGGLTNTVQVAAGYQHVLALTADHKVYAWGDNTYGELGAFSTEKCQGSINCSTTPLLVSSPLPQGKIVFIAAGDNFSLAVSSSGKVFVWGDNSYGEFGNGSTGGNSQTPTQVNNLTGTVVAVAANGTHAMALTSAGAVLAWGEDYDGETGNGTFGTSATTLPALVYGLTKNIVGIAAGGDHGVAVASNGKVGAWGYNSSGQLGNNSTVNSAVITLVKFPTSVVATSVAAGNTQSYAQTASGALYAWGSNYGGALGLGSSYGNVTTAAPVTTLSGTISAMGAGYDHTLAVVNGAAYAWGDNNYGESGTGTAGYPTNQYYTPTAVTTNTGMTNVQAVAGGQYFSVAIAH